MEILEWTYYGNTLRTWGFVLGVTAVLVLTLRALLTAFVRRLRHRRMRRVGASVDDGLDSVGLEVAERTRPLFLLIIAAFFATRLLYIPSDLAKIVNGVVVIALVIQAGLWGSAAIASLLGRVAERRGEVDPASTTTLGFLGFIARFILWSALVLLALQNAFGVNVNALLAGLGIGGIAVALAVQRVLGDLFASLSIVLDKPFTVGDFVVVGEVAGTVEHIGLKTTRVRSLAGEQVVFANAKLLDSRIHNFQSLRERRVVFTFSVNYDTPPGTLSAIPVAVREIIERQEQARFDRAHFASLGEHSLTFEVVYHVLDPSYDLYMDIQESINLGLLQRFAEMDVAFAVRTRAVRMSAVTPEPATKPVAEAAAGRKVGEAEPTAAADAQRRKGEEIEAEM